MLPQLSIIVPFLNEEASLSALKTRFENLDGLPSEREILFVSDGSTDGGPRIVEEWAAKDPRVKLIALTRNFGHQAAISAGLDRASGDFVGIMDADLQDPPEALLDMYRTARRDGFDIVYSVRTRRDGSSLMTLSYRLFYKAYSYLAETPVDPDSGDFCVLSRRALKTLRTMPERVRFIRGLRSWMGLKSRAFSTVRPAREHGRPQYSWTKLFSLALNGITSFSAKPLRLATVSGLVLCLVALLLTAFYLAEWLLHDIHAHAPGFTTIVILVLFLSGCQFLMMGIIGEYIAQIFWEVKRRPAYLVERTVNLDASENVAD